MAVKRINIEDIRRLEEEINNLNKLDLNQIELYIADEKITIPKKLIDNWKFTGLNNFHFFKDEFYLDENEE